MLYTQKKLLKLVNGGTSMANENVVFLGTKASMSYVLAVITQFNSGSSEVILKARGRAISRTVDVAEIVRRKFLPDVKLKKIEINTEELTGERGTKINVSTIEITLKK